MKIFRYKGYNNLGILISGEIKSTTHDNALNELTRNKIIVFELYDRSTLDFPWWKFSFKVYGKTLSYKEHATLSSLLSVLFISRIPITDAFSIIISSINNKELKQQFKEVEARVLGGMSMPDAFEKNNRLLSPILLSSFRVGYQSNTLSESLAKTALFFKSRDKIKQKIISALIYPMILVCVSFVMLFIILFYLIPNLEPIFTASDVGIPYIISSFMGLNSVLEKYWIVFLTIILLLGILSMRSTLFHMCIQNIAYKIPFISDLSNKLSLLQFMQSMDLLLSSGETLVNSLRIAASSLKKNDPLVPIFEDAANSVDSGLNITSVLVQYDRIPNIVVEMLKIGEQTNQISPILSNLCQILHLQTEQSIQNYLALLTPIITLTLGAIIGVLIYTIMGALLEVNNLVF